jgi:hypothetical protein
MKEHLKIQAIGLLLAFVLGQQAAAGVLPEDRADMLYHSYDGDNVTINGPSLLVRKQFLNNWSASANYYVDSVSSASIDVVTTASPYTEQRTQTSVGVDYLRGKWLMSLGYTKSQENDFLANSLNFTISQDMFGDLTTISLGYTLGWDEVGKRNDPDFMREVDRQHYRIGLSQVLTKNMIFGMSVETITDEGYLNNPYRSVRYLDPSDGRGYSYEAEVYPNTRTSTAVAGRLKYYLPYRAALHGEYRYFSDTWGIAAHTGEIGYTHPLDSGWIIEVSGRVYEQTAADFYSDLFPRLQAQNFLARDKELSTFASSSIRVGLTYEFAKDGWRFLERGSLSLFYDRMQFDYEDFRDLRNPGGAAPGEEPLFGLSADVLQVFLSVWF